MLKIALENGSAYEVLHETACYPSMSTTARSYLEIHMSADAMTLDEFYTLMTDSEATKKITLQNIDAEKPGKRVHQHLCRISHIRVLLANSA